MPNADPSREREGDAQRAQQLFDEALALSDQGQWATACPKFRASLAADAGVGTLLNVASCSAREGHVVDALREYRRARELNKTTKDDVRRAKVEAQVGDAMTELSKKIGTLEISVEPATAKPRVMLDGVLLSNPRAPIELQVGAHALAVEAAGFRTFRRPIAIVGGQTITAAVSLEAIPVPSKPVERRDDALSNAGWVTALVGVGGLATGSVLVALAADRASAVRDECGPDVAPPNCPLGDRAVANEISDEGQVFATGSYVAFGLGGAAVAAGIGMLIADATMPDERPVAVSFGASPEWIGVRLEGAFQ